MTINTKVLRNIGKRITDSLDKDSLSSREVAEIAYKARNELMVIIWEYEADNPAGVLIPSVDEVDES